MKENFYHINHDLLVKYLLEETSPGERLEAEQWIAASDANRKYFNELKGVWEKSKQVAASTTVNEEEAWERFRQRIHPPGKKQQAIVRHMGRRFSWMRVAALFIIIAGMGWLTIALLTYNKTITLQSQQTILPATLPDGSVVTLNKNSSVSYPRQFKGDTRNITLQGEAFFNVSPDKKKPFLIQVNDVTVKVVGTSFNVRNNNGNTEVIVETGIVQVIKQNSMIELRPKEKIMVTAGGAALAKQPVTDKLYNYYRSKEFVCDNTPLSQLVEVLNEAYNVHIVIERKELQNLPLTTTFYDESLDKILAIIAQTFNVSVVKSGDQVILK